MLERCRMKRKDISDKVLADGYNCAAAVMLAYADKHKLDKDFVLRLSGAFGVGTGNMNETCKAATGAVMLLGLVSENSDAAMQLSSLFLEKFENSCGSTVCRKIRGLDNGGIPLCSCEDAVRNAVEILEKEIL